MDDERRVLCPENRGLAAYVLQKKQEYAEKPKGLSENLERTFVKGYRSVCDAKDPINTLKDLSQIKYVSCFLSLLFSPMEFGFSTLLIGIWVIGSLVSCLRCPFFAMVEKDVTFLCFWFEILPLFSIE